MTGLKGPFFLSKKNMIRFFKILKIGDYILTVMILVGFFVGVFSIRSSTNEGQAVSIFVDNQERYHLRIFEDRTIKVQGDIGETVVRIEHGKVWIESAPCPLQLCKNMGKISRPGEIIVCIPNKLLIRIEGSRGNTIDGMTM
jgi:hypothetical protein